MDWTMSNLAGTTGVKSPSLLQMMLDQALEPDQQSELKIGKGGEVQMKVSPPELEGEKPTGEPAKKEGAEGIPQIPQAAMAEFLAPYAGPSAAELRGLTPEQVMSVVNAQRLAEQARGQTVGQLLAVPYQQAQIDLIRERIKELQEPAEEWATFIDEHGRWFRMNPATGDLRLVAGPPPTKPLTYEERMKLKKTAAEIPRGNYWKSPETGEIRWIEKPETPPAGWEIVPASQIREIRPTVFERKLPTYNYDMLVSYLKDKEGKLLEQPDIAGITAFNRQLAPEGKEIVEVAIKPLKKEWGLDWFAKDLPGRVIYIITDLGATSVSREDIENTLVSVYGVSPEDAKKVEVE